MRVIIVGGGKVGTYLATMLVEGEHWVRVIENRKEEIPRLQGELPAETVVWGNGTDPNVLESLGIRTANVMAAVTGSDETNLVVSNLARFEFQVPRIIARVNNPKNAWLYTPEMGVDAAVNQATLTAHLIAEEMSLGDMMTLLKLRKGQYALVEEKVHPTSVAVGKTIGELSLPSECVLVAVLRAGQLFIPRGDTVLEAVDEVIAIVHSSQQEYLDDLLGRTAS
ncbi:MAG: TrkA family potassium uptake protein [Chloroflexota bacterium]